MRQTTRKLVTVVGHHRQAAPNIPRRLDVSIPATRKAAAKARGTLSKLDLPLPLANDAQLAVSELVTNSVRHAGLAPDDRIRVTVHWSGTRLKVHVRDGRRSVGPAAVSGSIRPAPGAESGWGLYLVDRLSSRWGTSAHGYWFELHQDPPSPVQMLADALGMLGEVWAVRRARTNGAYGDAGQTPNPAPEAASLIGPPFTAADTPSGTPPAIQAG